MRFAKKVDKEVIAENETKRTIQTVIRSEHERKYSIPAACQNILIALIKSRKYNPFLFALFENESDDEVVSIFKKCGLDVLLPCFPNKLQKTLLRLKKAKDLTSTLFF